MLMRPQRSSCNNQIDNAGQWDLCQVTVEVCVLIGIAKEEQMYRLVLRVPTLRPCYGKWIPHVCYCKEYIFPSTWWDQCCALGTLGSFGISEIGRVVLQCRQVTSLRNSSTQLRTSYSSITSVLNVLALLCSLQNAPLFPLCTATRTCYEAIF